MSRKMILGLIGCLPVLMASTCERGAAITCPTPKAYSREFLTELDKELDVVTDKAPHIVQMLGDYDVTLRAIRACIKRRSK
jgi:hypothetical protein